MSQPDHRTCGTFRCCLVDKTQPCEHEGCVYWRDANDELTWFDALPGVLVIVAICWAVYQLWQWVLS